tara:strand:+ start:3742 stop:3891 length:150 start_codon:yes stop_codon:yes gene_type:complete
MGADWSGLEDLKLTEFLMDWEADGAISELKAEGYQCAHFWNSGMRMSSI